MAGCGSARSLPGGLRPGELPSRVPMRLSRLLSRVAFPRPATFGAANMSTMRAIAISQQGDLDVIEEMQLPRPTPGPKDVLIRVHWCGVNFRDTYVRNGLYPEKVFPHILGQEAVGVVEQLPTDHQLLQSPDFQNLGIQLGSVVATRAGHAFAEYIASPWNLTHLIPDGVPPEVACAGLVQGLTALTFMTEAYNVKRDDWVLVHTVAGGLGLIFAQIARDRGAKVIGTTSSKEKAELAKANGADHVIIYTQENTVDRVLELTNGRGVAVIYDGVGKDTWEADFQMIARKGTVVSVGNASGAVEPFPPLKLMPKNVKLLRPNVGNYITTPEEITYYTEAFWKLIKEKKVNIKIHHVYPFSAEGVKQSQRDITGRNTTGKLLIKL